MDSEVSGVNMMKDEETEDMETVNEEEGAEDVLLEEEISEEAEAADNAEDDESSAEAEEEKGDDDDEDEASTEAVVSNVTPLPQSGMQHLRMLEAMLFATVHPISEKELAARMPKGVDVGVLLSDLVEVYEKRGVVLEKIADKWTFRTASDLNYLFQKEAVEPKRLSKAGIETLAIIAYHQPVTRAEIEDIRGVTVSKGTVDLLLDVGWIRLRGRRRTPGRPITYGTTEDFLEHFSLEGVSDLPGLEDLKAAGLLDANLPPSFTVPGPSDQISDEEDPLEDEAEPDLLDALDVESVEEADEIEANAESVELVEEITEDETEDENFVEGDIVDEETVGLVEDEVLEEDEEEPQG